jgi:hypothetical protein
MNKQLSVFVILGTLFFLSISVFVYQLNIVEDTSVTDIQDNTLDLGELRIDPNTNFTRLDELFGYREYGGVPKDGIKSINIPNWISVDEAQKFMQGDDIVFGVTINDTVVAIPRKILVQHEIMNIDVNGVPIAIAYCRLTGSTIGYVSEFNGIKTTFGVSGLLINSNLVMYDRLTDSLWPQILGAAVNNDLKGVKLEKVQVFWSTWEKWTAKYPNSMVQSINTGYIRGANYNIDPYGSYASNSTYYTSGGPFFWVENYDPRLADKDIVIGIEHSFKTLAIEKEYLKNQKVINTQVGNLSIVVMYDEELDVARVYESEFEGQILSFSYVNGKFLDDINNIEWNLDGSSSIGSLKQHVYMDSMWFGWKAIFPETGLLQTKIN